MGAGAGLGAGVAGARLGSEAGGAVGFDFPFWTAAVMHNGQ
jgi:hypothetical protein